MNEASNIVAALKPHERRFAVVSAMFALVLWTHVDKNWNQWQWPVQWTAKLWVGAAIVAPFDLLFVGGAAAWSSRQRQVRQEEGWDAPTQVAQDPRKARAP